MNFHSLPTELIAQKLNTDITNGLSHKEAQTRLLQNGPNKLPQPPKPSLLIKFLSQFTNILILILLIATVISFFLGETVDAIAITSIVIINAIIGFVQEVNAEKTLESLKSKEIAHATVIRDGKSNKINAEELVVGDVIDIEEGNKIPADCRIIQSFAIRADESILTGESTSVGKKDDIYPENTLLADRKNMLFKDTKILSGRGLAIVIATGIDTQIGQIAKALQSEKAEKTPLTIELEHVGKALTAIILIIASAVFVINYFVEHTFVQSMLISITLAVAAIPEGLPAIVSIVLSLGVKRLALRRTLVKKLVACETLGSVKIIATDKTGTITQNKINASNVMLSDKSSYKIEGIGYSPVGSYIQNNIKINTPAKNQNLYLTLKCAILANNAHFSLKNTQNITKMKKNNLKEDSFNIIGDTTEIALLVAGLRAGINIDKEKNDYHRTHEIPFTSERKMMSVLVHEKKTGKYFLFAKGAPEIIMDKCNMSIDDKKYYLSQVEKYATLGQRSLSFSYKEISKNEAINSQKKDDIFENNMNLLGIIGMYDPLRIEVKQALNQAKKAGIRTIMITGDHINTALAIAREAGITDDRGTGFTDNQINKMSDKKLAQVIKEGVSVFARISPLNKLRIIKIIKSIPNTQVAVTGDGVNDAPALKAAHIGIAMGKSGTDITKEVADIVITDDNYATIIDAIREGRVIFSNLVKFIRYLISCNLSEVLVVSLAAFFRLPDPLLSTQLLWINLVTDSFPALALGIDPAEKDIMKKPPRDAQEGLLHKKRWVYMIIEGSIIGFSVLGIFLYALSQYDLIVAETIAFSTLALAQLTHAFNNRSTKKSLFEIGIFSNKYLVIAALISFVMQFLAVQTNFGNIIFKTVKLEIYHWLLIISGALLPLLIVETKKQLRIRFLP